MEERQGDERYTLLQCAYVCVCTSPYISYGYTSLYLMKAAFFVLCLKPIALFVLFHISNYFGFNLVQSADMMKTKYDAFSRKKCRSFFRFLVYSVGMLCLHGAKEKKK